MALLVGVGAGGAIGFMADRGVQPGPPEPITSPDPLRGPAGPSPTLTPIVPDTLLAWTPGGLPVGFGDSVRRLPGVERAVTVASGTAWLSASYSKDGARTDHPPADLAIPLEVAGADLRRYAAFLSPADRGILPLLEEGQAALGETSAELRKLGPGSTLVFGPTRVVVAGVLPDASIGAHEVFVSARTAARLGIQRERYLLIDPADGVNRKDLAPTIRALLPPGFLLRMRGPGETPYFRHGDAVLPPVRLKQLFGEFSARPVDGGFLDPDRGWVSRSITSASVPILGRIRCHASIVSQLRAALEEVQRRGLADLIDPGDYGGCFASRFINRLPSLGISHHSWGVAFDVNVKANAYGQTPHQDPRLVAIFERWGFTWGGHWLLPDGMHFEFAEFAPGA
jgi:hypothetical protein